MEGKASKGKVHADEPVLNENGKVVEWRKSNVTYPGFTPEKDYFAAFATEVELLKAQNFDSTWMEVLLMWGDQHKTDEVEIARLVKKNRKLKLKIEEEARANGCLKEEEEEAA